MMMHTFVGQSKEKVVEKVREPLSSFLRSHLDLIKIFTNSLDIARRQQARLAVGAW